MDINACDRVIEILIIFFVNAKLRFSNRFVDVELTSFSTNENFAVRNSYASLLNKFNLPVHRIWPLENSLHNRIRSERGLLEKGCFSLFVLLRLCEI